MLLILIFKYFALTLLKEASITYDAINLFVHPSSASKSYISFLSGVLLPRDLDLETPLTNVTSNSNNNGNRAIAILFQPSSIKTQQTYLRISSSLLT